MFIGVCRCSTIFIFIFIKLVIIPKRNQRFQLSFLGMKYFNVNSNISIEFNNGFDISLLLVGRH